MRHAVLISGDPGHLERLEHALRKAWPDCRFHRAHPQGALAVPKAALAQSESIAIWDRRTRLRAELRKLLRAKRVVALAPLPARGVDLDELITELSQGMDLLAHNLDWRSAELGQTLARAIAHQTLAEPKPRKPLASGQGELADPKLKPAFVEELVKRLGQIGLQRTRRARIASVVDELLMNALYHAARPQSAATRAACDASWSVSATPSGVASDFRATVLDHYGSYAARDALRKVMDFFGQQMVEVTRTRGRGGGVGLFLVLKTSASYRLFIDPGHSTEVSVRIPCQSNRAVGGDVSIYLKSAPKPGRR